MELRIKQKIIDGEKMMGVIDENLKEIVPFMFREIQEVKSGKNLVHTHHEIYFICKREDGTCSLYNQDGCCLLDFKDGYKNLHILSYSNKEYSNIAVSAKKDGQVGILYIGLSSKQILSKTRNVNIRVAYGFGKCDEIKELKDGTVLLIKHKKTQDRIGYWYHKNIGEVVEPKYLTYDYFTMKCIHGVRFGSSRNYYCTRSNNIALETLTFNVEMIEYTKLRNNRKVIGLKQKEYIITKKGRLLKFNDLLPAEYSDIHYDSDKQIFFLKQMVDGKIKKGFVGVSFKWNLDFHGWLVSGYPTLDIAVSVPCIYDDLNIIGDNDFGLDRFYAIVKKDSKYGLIYFLYNKSYGDYDSNDRERYLKANYIEVVPCIYDSLVRIKGAFVGTINNEKHLITECINQKTKEPIIIPGNYKSIYEFTKNVYVCELPEEKKDVVIINKNSNSPYTDSCTVHRITSCDYLDMPDKNLITITKNGITDVYSLRNPQEKVEENIRTIIYDYVSDTYIVNKNNNHIIYIDNRVNYYREKPYSKVFSTEDKEFDPNNISVEYLRALEMFKVTNGNFIKMYSDPRVNNGSKIYENRIFKSFNALKTEYYTFIGYTELLEDNEVTKLIHVDVRNNMKETEILSGNFQINDIVLGGKRIIISVLNHTKNEIKYGVIESREGNVCIDCVYDYIKYDTDTQMFICKTNENDIHYCDIDGFYIDNPNLNNNNTQSTLKLTLH